MSTVVKQIIASAAGGSMQDQEKTAIGFWPTYLIVLIGLLAVAVVDGKAWGTMWNVKASGLILALLGGGAYFYWRGYRTRSRLLRTGLEWVYGLALLALFGSWILSPDPRQGLARIGWMLAYLILFYILVDALEAGADRRAALAALLTASGIFILMAALETAAVYSGWWAQTGSRQIMPPYPYRFVSVVGHSNALMGLANLCAPLALISFLRSNKRIERALLAFWLVVFLAVIPFSSSRGGWLGTATWMGGLFCYWLWMQKPLQRWKSMQKRARIITIVLGIVILVALAAGGYIGFTKFAQHPSHGSNMLGGRSEIWSNALNIWLSSLWFGAGPGRFGFGYLNAATSTPPGFWALHAHSLPIQVLAEFGLVGAVAMAALLVGSLRWFWRRFRELEENKRIWGIAILASCVAWAVQLLVDDQTGVAVVMVSLVFLLAWYVTLPETPLPRWQQVNLNFLILPALMIACGAGWGLRAYEPLSRGMLEMKQDDSQAAAPLFAASMQRDPNFSFYATQAGYAWASAAAASGTEEDWIESHSAFEKSLKIEPDVSLLWADMAVVDWQSRRFHDKAVSNMQHAIALSPNEASYYLNLGWFYEKQDFHDQAVAAYTRALEFKPGWANHPFWQVNVTRQAAAAGLLPDTVGEDLAWVQARTAIGSGDLRLASLLLAKAEWMGESPLAVQISRGLLAEAQGDRAAAVAAYEKVAGIVSAPVLHSPHQFMLTYTVWMNHRQGLTHDLVPGYLQLDSDVGQFTALERLYATYHEMGECENAGRIWHIWHQAVHGGALDVIPPAPACP
jgi:tetratricopeptide (TPR) repeat protein/O-antigen ligase